jgi:uroporphyrinogen-III synthase
VSEASINVLVTRPEYQASALVELLKKRGFTPFKCPTIAISPPDTPSSAIAKLQQLSTFDYVIFISANAATQADALLEQQWPKTAAPIIAIGPKTRAAIENIGLKVTLTAAAPFTSEQLITSFSEQFKVPEKARSLIIKGQGGRNYLASALNSLNISVNTADVYRRTLPKKALSTLPNKLSYITITSQLALDNLFLLYPNESNRLKSESTFIVLSKRIAKHAESLGCKRVCVADLATNEGILSALLTTINK